MGDLDEDTRIVSEGGGRYRGTLSENWSFGGLNGGYIASVALRAAGCESGRARPASLLGSFLTAAQSGDVDMQVEVLRRSRFATSVSIMMSQGGNTILHALVWGIDDGGVELVHASAQMPEVPPPGDLAPFDEHPHADEHDQSYPFWRNLEHRRFGWRDHGPPTGPKEPRAQWWVRYRPTACFDDPWIDACRLLIPIDAMGWPAGVQPHAFRQPLGITALTIDLSVRFHRLASDAEWLLCDAVSPFAAGGLVTATGHVWTSGGSLLASGGQSLLCRPVPAV